MFALGMSAFYEQDYERMLDWAKRSLDVAKAIDDAPLVGAAAALGAFAATLRPETIAEAHALHAEASAVIEAMSRRRARGEPERHLVALPRRTSTSTAIRRASRTRERGLAVARATGQGDFFPGLIQALANLLFQSGRPAEAAELLDGAIEAARLSQNKVGVAWSLLNRGFCRDLRGRRGGRPPHR